MLDLVVLGVFYLIFLKPHNVPVCSVGSGGSTLILSEQSTEETTFSGGSIINFYLQLSNFKVE